ncbi:MAG: Na+/H+ antiporter NhaD/arsenite permease-like protein [Oleispira sp.]|mgnify:FL=1|jgi:Na+/H+ antiporter NhaD/arsenite permease-like protein|tara:strand:- start:4053 stop:5297 length:1245 start_codon:yes stop_codon:yes gene_type:complete
MSAVSILLIIIVSIGFLSIIAEDLIKVNKAKSTLFWGTLAWIVYFISSSGSGHTEAASEALNENLLDIATLWLFLFSAMTFVAYLSEKGVIEIIAGFLLPKQLSEKGLLFFIGTFSFIFSSLADNITATLVSLTILLGLNIDRDKLIKYAIVVIYGVNAGGVSLITGDVTTLMIFLADKVSISDLLMLVLPAFTSVILLCILMSFGMNGRIDVTTQKHTLSSVDTVISALFFFTIIGVIFGNVFFSIPPVLSFLFGLSVMFMVARVLDRDEPILDYVRKIEFDTLLFFLGVLLLVGMLKEIGVLELFLEAYKQTPTLIANYVVGITSALFDNVPLTSAILKSGIDMANNEWLALTFSVGVGGALLAIGSAAGVIAMSKIPELTFMRYLRFFPQLFIAYTAGYALVVLFIQVMTN